ncbi:MAG TPA: hypothetical protein VFW45_11815, partial [Candidatus Polarisedimenticolia bacterium]|nr:hypothetical protein [Candidatus Polarisedimenticolia bacterium]
MKRTRRSWAGVGVLCLLAMGILSLVIANDGDISWEGKGPGGGGSNLGVAVDPKHPDKVLMGSDTGGIYRTEDGGGTWENKNVGAITDPYGHRGHYFVESFAYDPEVTDRVYAGTLSGVLKSTDGGASWTQSLNVYGGAAVVAVNPNHTEHVYAGSGSIFGPGNAWGFEPGPVLGCIFISGDYGATFGSPVSLAGNDCSIANGSNPNVRSILIDPTPGPAWDATKILVSTNQGLYRSLNGGQTWSLLSGTGLPHQNCGQLAYDPSTGTVYISMLTEIDDRLYQAGVFVDGYRSPDSWQGGVYRSIDWGTTGFEPANGIDGSDILPNGGFEIGGTPPSGWNYLANSSGNVSRVAHQGGPDSWDLKIETDNVDQPVVGVQTDAISVTPGARYRVSAFGKANQLEFSSAPDAYPTSFFGRIFYFSDIAGTQGVAESRCVYPYTYTNLWAAGDLVFDWRRYETEVLIPDNAVSVRIWIYTNRTRGVTLANNVTLRLSNSLPTIESFQGFTYSGYRALALGNDPSNNNSLSLYVGTDLSNFNPVDGVWKSADGGISWTHETRFVHHDNVIDKRANTEPADPLDPNDHGGCGFGYGYGRIYGIGTGKGAVGHDTLFMSTGFWSYKKAHGSATWEEITHDADPSAQRTFWKGRGVTNDVVTHDVKAEGSMVFYGDQDNLLLISDDSGETYRQEGRDRKQLTWGSLGLYGGTVSSIVVEDQGHAYATVEGGQGSGVVSVSFNSGLGTWDPTRVGGIPGVDPGALPEGGPLRLGQMDGTLYAAMEGSSRGVYRKDSGWTNIGAAGVGVLPSIFIPSQVAVDDVKNRLYVGLRKDLFCSPPCDKEAPCNSGACLFLAINPGSGTPAWCRVTHNSSGVCLANAPCDATISSLKVGPANELYVGTTRSLTSPGGLYKATAAGCSSPSGSCTTCTWTWSRLLDEP